MMSDQTLGQRLELAALDALIDEGFELVAELCKSITLSPREPMDWLCGATRSKVTHRKLRDGLHLSVEVMYRETEPVYIRLWLSGVGSDGRTRDYKRESRINAAILQAAKEVVPV